MPQPTARDLPRWKKALFAAVATCGLFAALELALWVFGVETVIEREDPFRGFSGLVSVFERDGDTFRTARIEGPQTFNDQSFLATKPANGLRVFVLGGSSSYGFPWGNEASFAAHLRDALALSHTDRTVEVVNVSGVSYAMHRIVIIMRELARYEPDLVVVYSGHNEFVERSHFEALREQGAAWNRLNAVMAHSRIYSLLHAMKPKQTGSTKATGLGAVVRRDQTQRFTDAEKAEVVRDYEAGLREVVSLARAAGADVLLNTVPCNLRDWRPQASTPSAGIEPSAASEAARQHARAEAALTAGNPRDGSTAIETSLRLRPGHAESHYLAAKIREALGDWDGARAEYATACDRDASPIRRVGGVNEAIRRIATDERTLFVDADAVFERLSEHGLVGLPLVEDYVHPTTDGHVHLGWHMFDALARAGWQGTEPRLAREEFDAIAAENLATIDRRNATWFYNQGYLLTNQGLIDEAIEKYRDALRIEPNHDGALNNLAFLLLQNGDTEESIAVSERLLAVDPTSPSAGMTLALALDRAERTDDALAAVRSVLENHPDRVPALVLHGRLLARSGDTKAAEATYSRALERDAECAPALRGLGALAFERGAFDEAAKAYRAVLRIDPTSAEDRRALARTELRLGSAQLGAGRPDDALRHLETAARLDPDDANNHLNLGSLLIQLKRSPDAVVSLRRALDIDPNSATGHKNLGFALAVQKQWDDAVHHLRRAVELAPQDREAQRYLEMALENR